LSTQFANDVVIKSKTGMVNDYSSECLALVADTSVSGLSVTRDVNELIKHRGGSNTIVSDNGNVLTSTAVLK
jgi:putative transposase